MLRRNVGGIDRILRIAVGLVLLVAFFFGQGEGYRWLFLVGVVPLVTGLVGTCPLYSLFGFSTCPMKRS